MSDHHHGPKDAPEPDWKDDGGMVSANRVAFWVFMITTLGAMAYIGSVILWVL